MSKNSTFKGKVLPTMVLVAIALLQPQPGWSRIIEYTQDKIDYELNTSTKEATVTSLRSIYTTASVPDSVVYENNTYRVTAIGFQANYQNGQVKKIELGKYVQFIDSCAFTGNRSLASITIPKCLKFIGGMAFQSCAKLDTIALPEGLEYIGAYSFYSSGLKTLHIPASVKHLGENPVRESSKLASITVAAANPYYKEINGAVCTKDGKNLLFVPTAMATTSYSIPDGVEYVAPYAMRNTSAIKGLIIPASVTTVGRDAFCRMGMKTLKIGSGLKNIGYGAFSYCTELASITVDPGNANMKSVNNNVLSKDGKTLLVVTAQNADYTVPSGVEHIAPYVFYGMTEMTGINLNDVRTIGTFAFYHADKLTNVNWGTKLETIDTMAFQYSGLTSVILPPSVRSIKFQAFTYCRQNAKLVLPEGIAEIGRSAFLNNRLLKEVKVPSTLINMGDAVFYQCDSLRKVVLPDNMTRIPPMTFNYCRAMTEVNYPAALREIGYSAFTQCHMTNFDLPATVEVIGDMAFEDTKIGPDITLPPMVTVINRFAFTGCNNMKSFTAHNGIKP